MHVVVGTAGHIDHGKSALVKAMTGTEIQIIDGKLFPRVWKMQKADKEDEYTMLEYRELLFKDNLPGDLFTLSSLKNPGR